MGPHFPRAKIARHSYPPADVLHGKTYSWYQPPCRLDKTKSMPSKELKLLWPCNKAEFSETPSYAAAQSMAMENQQVEK